MLIKNGYFKFFKDVYNFELVINTLGFQVNILQEDNKVPLEEFLEYTNMSMLKNLIYECYITSNLNKIFESYINYDIPNVDFIRTYGALTIVIDTNIDTVHKISELIYEYNYDSIKIGAKIISKIYNMATNEYNYSSYHIEDFLLVGLEIDNIISTLSLLNKSINIENYDYKFIEDVNHSDFENANYEQTYASIQALEICNINDYGEFQVNYLTDSLYESFDEILTNTTSENIKEQILYHNCNINLEDFITKVF